MLRLYLKKWVFLATLIVVDAIIAIRTSIGFFSFFFWLLFSAVVFGGIWIGIVYLTLKLNLIRQTVSRVEEDDYLQVGIAIKNRGYLPIFNLVIKDQIPWELQEKARCRIYLDYLGPKSSLESKYSCFCSRRGKYRLGPIKIYFFDPFNLFFFTKTYDIYADLYVYPKTFKIREFPSLAKGILPWFGIQTTRVSGDEDEFFGIREYKEGDSTRRIHWVSTARKNRLIVKEFQRQSFFRATIVFNLEKDKDFGEGKNRVSEYIIKIAASLAKYLTERDVSLAVVAHVGEIVYLPFNKGRDHLDDIMRFLASARAESRVSLSEIFREFSRVIPEDSSLIVIMSDEDYHYLPAILSLQKRDVLLIPLVVIANTFLNPSESQNIARQVKLKLSQRDYLKPRFFARGDNPEEVFLKK